MQIDRVGLIFAAGESISGEYELGVHNISAMQPRGLRPYIVSVSLPADWSAATLSYEISDEGEHWEPLSDLRGMISAAGRPGMRLSSTVDTWRGVRWVRLRSEPPQKQDVRVEIGIGAYEWGK